MKPMLKTKQYRNKVEVEIINICNDIIAIIDKHLIPSFIARKSFSFYYKMKGDYYQYIVEFKSSN